MSQGHRCWRVEADLQCDFGGTRYQLRAAEGRIMIDAPTLSAAWRLLRQSSGMLKHKIFRMKFQRWLSRLAQSVEIQVAGRAVLAFHAVQPSSTDSERRHRVQVHPVAILQSLFRSERAARYPRRGE